MTVRIQIAPMRKEEVHFQTFDFLSDLAVGETIATQVVTATVYSGTDANPSHIIKGAATASGTVVTQLLTAATFDTAGVLGTIYTILCYITTSLGQGIGRYGYLVIVPSTP